MLVSYWGTIDAAGLRSLHVESPDSAITCSEANVQPFWAVLDSEELPPIHSAWMAGRCVAALRLLEERSRSIGRVTPDR